MPILFGKEVSQDVFDDNKHLEKPAKEGKTAARKQVESEMKQRFARTFEANWQLLGGPPLKPEHYFHPTRRWRADYLCEAPTGRWLIELDGGVWTGGRHTRGKGYIEDAFKVNTAVMLGYRVVRIATGMATDTYLSTLIAAMKGDLDD